MNNDINMPTIEPDNLTEEETNNASKCPIKKKVIPIEEISEVCLAVIKTIGEHTPEKAGTIGGK